MREETEETISWKVAEDSFTWETKDAERKGKTRRKKENETNDEEDLHYLHLDTASLARWGR